jgi:hypothetical protein
MKKLTRTKDSQEENWAIRVERISVPSSSTKKTEKGERNK